MIACLCVCVCVYVKFTLVLCYVLILIDFVCVCASCVCVWLLYLFAYRPNSLRGSGDEKPAPLPHSDVRYIFSFYQHTRSWAIAVIINNFMLHVINW